MAKITIKKQETLMMQVVKYLRYAIIEADFKLGDVLSEEKIAASLNISRTPVREAFSLLQMQGLIEIVPKKGSFVFLPSTRDVSELADFRAMLEQQGAVFSLERNQRAMNNDLQKAFSLMEKATQKKDPIAYARADHLFHQAFFDYCDNQYLKEAYSVISWRMSALRSHLAGPSRLFDNRALAEHQQIIDNAERHDLNLLFKTIHQHCVAMKGFYSRAIEEKLVETPRIPPRLKGPRRKKEVEAS